MADRQLLALPEVLETLAGNYEVHGTSPRFLTDWRWYKSLTGESANWNEMALRNYYSKNLNLIDKRFEYGLHSPAFEIWLEETAQLAWDCMCRIEAATAMHGTISTAFPMSWSRGWAHWHLLPRPRSRRRHPSFGVMEAATPASGLHPDSRSGGDAAHNT